MTPTASFPYSAAASSTRVGIKFCACYFKPDSGLNDTAVQLYVQNVICCYRQWYYSAGIKKSVDMVLTVNGIQVFAFELKISTLARLWRMPNGSGCTTEICFQFNKRILGYFCVDRLEVWMAMR